jgi:two-component system chemotaxis sensor kinase CheA
MDERYKQGYIEETLDLLAEMESALLQLDQKRDDVDAVGRAFRALHTIKGTGAMFGFDDIARFTHDLETAFDQLRKGQIAATPELIKLTLTAGDQIKAMLVEANGGSAADPAISARILAELRELTGLQKTEQTVVLKPPATPQVTDYNSTHDWRIYFKPGPNVFSNGMNPLLLLRELRTMGQLRVDADISGVPPLSDMDPESCYLAWNMVLTTSEPLDTIRDVFVFVEGDSEVTIAPTTEQVAKAGKKVNAGGTSDARSAGGTAMVTSLRVSTEKLDQLVNLVGELVTVQARLSEFAARQNDPEFMAISEDIDRLTGTLRENSMSLRMLPLKTIFERFHRQVHDLSLTLNKKVDLVIEGGDTELDKTVIDQLNDPLVHLIRNSMDHGIETPEARRAAGKNPTAKIRLSALHSGANVLIRISDDGRGLNVEAVRARAVEQGLLDSSQQVSESEILSLIWAPGFSTAREVTNVSGRGVGMDVVRRSIEALRGRVEIDNQPGVGLTITLRLPLTLAIIDGLLVRVGRSHFVLPLANSLECVELTEQDIQDAHGNHVANVRGEFIPYIRLSEYFQMQTERLKREQIMVVETEYGQYGFVIDEVLGDHQTVIKSLGKLYQNVQGISGATILGNGTVALILDPHRLVQNIVQTLSPSRPQPTTTNRIIRKENTSHAS